MPTYTVVFAAEATSVAIVDVPDGTGREDVEDAAWQKLNTGLCHQCARDVTLGDFEPSLIEDEDGDVAFVESKPDTLTLAEVRAVLLDISASIYGQLRHEGNDRQAIAEEAERRIDVLLALMED